MYVHPVLESVRTGLNARETPFARCDSWPTWHILCFSEAALYYILSLHDRLSSRKEATTRCSATVRTVGIRNRSEARCGGGAQGAGSMVGLAVKRHFTTPGADPFASIEWTKRIS